MTDPRDETAAPGDTIRALMRRATQATLATRLVVAERPDKGERGSPGTGTEGWPYASLVQVALDHDASPLLLISDLADHTRNLRADDRVALLFDGTAGYAEPLAGPRASLLGRAVPAERDPRLTARYVARHPGAETYLGFRDFHLFRVAVESAHLVAGFGRIHWVQAGDLLYDASNAAALAEAEPNIVAHMNEDHRDATALMARHLLGRDDGPWHLTGVDPEGADLADARSTARLDFDKPVTDAESCRVELVRLTKRARRIAEGGSP